MGGRLCLVLALLAPTLAVAEPEAIWISSVSASSTLPNKKNAYDPRLALEPKTTYIEKTDETRYDSAWCEGKPDEGIGEAITINFAVPTTLEKVIIRTGVWKTQKLFDANNIITGLELVTDDGRKLASKPAMKREPVEIKVGGAAVNSVVVKITSVKKGKMNDSCITDIDLDGKAMAVGFDKAAATAFPAALKDAYTAIWDTCDTTLLTKYFDFPFTYVVLQNTGSSDENKRFKKRPQTFKNVAALQKSCKGGTFGKNGYSDKGVVLAPSTKSRFDIEAELADVTQTMRMIWRGGQWRVTKID